MQIHKRPDTINWAMLINVNAEANNNKFYEIVENPDHSLDCYYGRVGADNCRTAHYNRWDKDFHGLKWEKESRGYSDQTALYATVEKTAAKLGNTDLDYKAVGEVDTDEMLKLLIESARDFIKNNYTVEVNEITPKMIEEAMSDLMALADVAESQQKGDYHNDDYWKDMFNKQLNVLMRDVPREMKKVNENIAMSVNDFADIIEREQAMIDNLKGQIKKAEPVKNKEKDKDITVLDAYGLTCRPVNYAEEDQILKHLGKDYQGSVEKRYIKAFAVENKDTREKYEKFKKDHNISPRDVKLFYHGSKVENWFSIMKTGLSLNPNARVTGKMFGNGIYFASDCRKSLNYMDTKHSRWNDGNRDSGYTAIYAVALGKCYEPYNSLSSSFSAKNLPSGCFSVYADKHKTGLQNDEYIIYNEGQCTIKYLVEFTQPRVRELSFHIDRNIVRDNISKGFSDIYSRGDGKMVAEFSLENLPDNVRTEFMKHGFSNAEMDRCYIVYTPDRNKGTIAFEMTDIGKNRSDLDTTLTNDDKAFLMREMKKVFCKSELEWKEIVEKSKQVGLNRIVCSKPDDEKSHRKHNTKGKE